jgi:hypothetical protein
VNIYEVEDEVDGHVRHLVGFMDAGLADAVGLVSHAMIGEFRPGPEGGFDTDTFSVNPEFLDVVTQFLNAQPECSVELVEGARRIPGERLYLVDPRSPARDDEDPPPEDVLGWYEVDPQGRVVPDSFRYNEEHVWFSQNSGISGLLVNREFYEFVHAQARGGELGGGRRD